MFFKLVLINTKKKMNNISLNYNKKNQILLKLKTELNSII